MQDSGSFFNVWKEYFSNTAMLPLFFIAVICLLKKWNNEKKYACVIAILISIIFVYNGLTYYVISAFGEGETYYRLIWICPMALLVAVFFAELLQENSPRQRYSLLLVFVLILFAFSSRPLTNWMNIPKNVYQVEDDVIEVADALMELTDGERTTIFDNANLRNEMRQYNAQIAYTEACAEELSYIFHLDNMNYLGRELMNYLRINNAQYVVLDKEKVAACRLIETTDVKCIVETENYYIYTTNHAQMGNDEEKLVELQENIGVFCNLEYIQSSELTGNEEFIYISDFGTGRNETFYQNVINEINARESKFVIINSELANEADWYADIQAILDDLEVPYYCNNQEFQVIEQEEISICFINNVTGISDEVMKKFQEFKNTQRPFLLVLSKEISESDNIYEEVMSEDSKVVGILTARKEKYKKYIHEGRVLQYATEVDENTFFTIVRLKGLELE